MVPGFWPLLQRFLWLWDECMNGSGKLSTSESGATGIEYGLIAGLVALAIIVGAQVTGNGLNQMFTVIGVSTNDAAAAAASSSGN